MINLSFAGCGFLGIYHVGVASCFHEYAPHVLVSKIAGASVGSIAAAALICNVSLGQVTTDILAVAVQARSGLMGPLSPRFDLNQVLRERLENSLPQDAHKLCSGRLFISVTRWADKKNVLLSQFNSRQELVQALLCSCFIPLYSGFNCPVFQGERYADGGMSDNLPVLDENTITVSPFAGEHDICPQDESCNILQVNLANTSIAVSPGNIYRMYRILFPPKPEILSRMCQQGFDDALRFLQRKNVITCTRCLGIQSVVQICDSGEDFEGVNCGNGKTHAPDNCSDCTLQRLKAKNAQVPNVVMDAITRTCDEVNKGAINWLLRRRPVKVLHFLSLPYLLPLDISVVIFAKVWEQMPHLRKEMRASIGAILALVKKLLYRVDPNKKIYSAMFSCELAVTEYDYTEANVNSSYGITIPNSQPHETCQLTTENETPRRKTSLLPPTREKFRQQRKSYAGFPTYVPNNERIRRKSFSEVSHPERVIRNMKFGFSVDLQSKNDRKREEFFQSLQSLSDVDSDLNIVHLANKALKMEREFLSQYHPESSSNESVLDIPSSDALMSYSYIDEDKTVKITEIYNVTDADTSAVLTNEERQVNGQLEWEKNWIDPPELRPRSRSIVDTLDDNEFDLSDGEVDLSKNTDSFEDNNRGKEDFNIPEPQRKSSFIIVN